MVSRFLRKTWKIRELAFLPPAFFAKVLEFFSGMV